MQVYPKLQLTHSTTRNRELPEPSGNMYNYKGTTCHVINSIKGLNDNVQDEDADGITFQWS